MKYSVVADYFQKLEETSGRLQMTEILSSLFKETPKSDLPVLAYLMQGKLRPDYEGVELGIAEKLALRALGTASGKTAEEVRGLHQVRRHRERRAGAPQGRRRRQAGIALLGAAHPQARLRFASLDSQDERRRLDRVEAQGARQPAQRREPRRGEVHPQDRDGRPAPRGRGLYHLGRRRPWRSSTTRRTGRSSREPTTSPQTSVSW